MIGTQQYSPYIYIFRISNSVFTSNNNTIFYVTTKDIYKKESNL